MRRSRGALLVGPLLAVALATGCADAGPPGQTPAPPSGIRGTVILGPTCPLNHEPGSNEPVPCLTPYSARLAVVDPEGRAVTHVVSASDGTFEVTVPPGEYMIAPENGEPYPFAQPLAVLVLPGEYAVVQVNYDTGIR